MVFANWLEILFTATEVALLIYKRSEKEGTRSNRDRRSLLLLWLVIGGSMTYTSITEHRHTWPLPGDAGLITGIIIFGLGFIIRWTAIVQLGKMFTVNVAIHKDLCFLALSFRISVEEAVLTDNFGEQYRNYKRRVARLIPWVY